MNYKQTLITLTIVLAVVNTSPIKKSLLTSQSAEKRTVKRGLGYLNFGYGSPFSDEYNSASKFGALTSPWAGAYKPIPQSPSPSEVASIIAQAKQASANVLIAQQQVQAAKDNVLNQQKMAYEKEAQATMAQQKSEAQAAVLRSDAAGAAQSVILAQQRLAHAKASVAHQQKIASAKEAHAASAIHSSAHAAAAEIQRTEQESEKQSAIYRDNSASAIHHVTATKDSLVSPLTLGGNNIPNAQFPLQLNGNSWNGFSSPAAMGVASPWTSALYVPKPAYNLWG